MTDEMVGMTRDRYHRYRWNGGDPMPSATAILKLQDAMFGSDNLTAWAAGLAADHVIAHSNRIDGDPNGLAALRAEAVGASKGPANLGTDVHEQVRRIIAGEPIEPTSATAPFLAQFAAFLAAEKPDFVLAEEMIANLTLGYAGQFDFIAKLRGKPSLVDVKTGKEKPTFRLQIAGYQGAEFIGRPGDPNPHEMPKTTAGYVLLLHADGWRLIEATPTKADRDHFAFLAGAYRRVTEWSKTPKEIAA